MFRSRDFLHAVPESLFEADAGLVTGDHDRAFDEGRIMMVSAIDPVLIQENRGRDRCLILIARAFGFGAAAKRRAVGIGLFGRLIFPRCATSEPVQVDHSPLPTSSSMAGRRGVVAITSLVALRASREMVSRIPVRRSR